MEDERGAGEEEEGGAAREEGLRSAARDDAAEEPRRGDGIGDRVEVDEDDHNNDHKDNLGDDDNHHDNDEDEDGSEEENEEEEVDDFAANHDDDDDDGDGGDEGDAKGSESNEVDGEGADLLVGAKAKGPGQTPPRVNTDAEPDRRGNERDHDQQGTAEEEQSLQREKAEKTWLRREKNIVVFSRAGKPIYSSEGDEFQLSSIFGLLQAMLAKTDDRLKVIRAGKNFVIVFAARGPLLLATTSRGQDPVGYLQLQLEYIYAQILVHFTLSALVDTFKRRPGYDMRSMIGGARTELQGIVDLAESTPTLMLAAVPTLAVAPDVRAQTISTLNTARQANLLYAILLAGDKLVAHVSPKRHPLHASDLVLLINFVRNAKQLRSQETWTPLCLPAFNSTGFLHAYAAYVSEDLCLLLLSSGESLDQFHHCSETKTKIAAHLTSSGLKDRLERAVSMGDIAPEACEAATSVHLVYRSLKYDQYFESRVASHAPLHNTPSARRRLISRYIGVSERLHAHARGIQIVSPLPFGTDPQGHPSQQELQAPRVTSYADACEQGHLWDVRETEAVLAVVSPGQYEVYATFHIFTSATQAMACVARFAAWVRSVRNERFMSKPATW